jgi:uncharacterized glyoxalase superfamily protein PhnB
MMGPGMSWIELAPRGQGVTVSLATWFETMKQGGLQGLMVNTDDVDAEREVLRGRGLETSDNRQEPCGCYAMFNDPHGNGWTLRQPLVDG